MRREFLAKRHDRYDSFSILGPIGWRSLAWQPRPSSRSNTLHEEEKGPARSSREEWNQWRSFLFPRRLLAPICRQAGACPKHARRRGEASVSVGGGYSLAFDDNEEDGDRGRKPGSDASDDSAGPSSKPAPRGKARGVSPGVGNALREAYQEALREDVPPEMLDLLGKLG